VEEKRGCSLLVSQNAGGGGGGEESVRGMKE